MDPLMVETTQAPVQRPKRYIVFSLITVGALLGAFALGRVTAPQAGYLGGSMPMRPATSSRASRAAMAELPDLKQAVFGRREALQSAAAAAASTMPLAANAYDYNQKAKAKATFGQVVFDLQGASAEKIAEEKNAIISFASQMIKASGKRNVDARQIAKGGGAIGEAASKAVKAATGGDTAGAQAAVKELVALTGVKKIPPFGSPGNPNTGGVSFTSMSGTRGTAGTW